ncbi:TetR family transcriptional regulator [Nostocoides sp. F2B08]|uniref:TetR/AcrR family transcriptional regulator n=1 Tax=Nostocoides sp. F2B08 TaxID=2653936 RepID=UPI001262D2E1|nr:TetR/AcrR family transcriptional regulator [Tetrasphaera sp. F2B08]KAB7739394.1 TetR family transcriptional regulator [Tetrasphaera sp. F2B08]
MRQRRPAAEKSRAWLVEALLSLMAEKPYTEITITEITTRAKVSRRTFYRNFATKNDLLDAYSERLMLEYVEQLRVVANGPMEDIVLMHFTFWTEHLDFLAVLARNGMIYLVLQKYNEYNSEVAERSGSTRYLNTPKSEYARAFNTGGYFNLLFEWLRRGANESPEEMAATFAHTT